jgi:hypothetical protein
MRTPRTGIYVHMDAKLYEASLINVECDVLKQKILLWTLVWIPNSFSCMVASEYSVLVLCYTFRYDHGYGELSATSMSKSLPHISTRRLLLSLSSITSFPLVEPNQFTKGIYRNIYTSPTSHPYPHLRFSSRSRPQHHHDHSPTPKYPPQSPQTSQKPHPRAPARCSEHW